MKIRINGKLGIKASGQIAHDKGLLPGGHVQKTIDNEVIKQIEPFVPRRDGGGYLAEDAFMSTIIGSGLIHQNGPYARFQDGGKVMIYEPTGSTWAPKYGAKVLTDRDLKYNGAPQRGAHYFRRMKEARGEVILGVAQKELERGKR